MDAANKRPLKVLARLIAKGHDVAHLYRASLGRLEAESCRRTARAVYRLHTWRNLELASASLLLGGVPYLPGKPGLRAWWKASWLRRADIRTMQRLHSAQSELIGEFDAALAAELPPRVRAMLERHRADLARHRSWIAFRASELEGRAGRIDQRRRQRSTVHTCASGPRVGESAA